MTFLRSAHFVASPHIRFQSSVIKQKKATAAYIMRLWSLEVVKKLSEDCLELGHLL